MLISREIGFDDLAEELRGCGYVLEAIENVGLQAEFMGYLEESFPNEIPDMQTLNHFIRYCGGEILEYLKEECPSRFEDGE